MEEQRVKGEVNAAEGIHNILTGDPWLWPSNDQLGTESPHNEK